MYLVTDAGWVKDKARRNRYKTTRAQVTNRRKSVINNSERLKTKVVSYDAKKWLSMVEKRNVKSAELEETIWSKKKHTYVRTIYKWLKTFIIIDYNE